MHIYLNGCKMCYVDNKNNLLCMNAFTWAMTLIVDKKWKKSFDHFGGLYMRFFSHFLLSKKKLGLKFPC